MATQRSNALSSAVGKQTNKVDSAPTHSMRRVWAVF